MTPNDGGPVFAQPKGDNFNPTGMTLRDLFAAVALHAMLTRPGSYDPTTVWKVVDQVLQERAKGGAV